MEPKTRVVHVELAELEGDGGGGGCVGVDIFRHRVAGEKSLEFHTKRTGSPL